MAFTFNLAPPRVGVPERDWSFMDTIMQRREDRKAGEAAVQSAQGLTPEQIEQVSPLLKNRQTMPEGLRMIREWRKPQEFGFTTAPDGTLLRTNAQAGTAEAIGNYAKPAGAGGAGGVYGNPIYGRDPESGQVVLGAMGKDGTFRRVDTGGVEINPGLSFQDFGTHRVGFDRFGRPVTGDLAVDNRGKAEDTKTGQLSAEREAERPQATAALSSATNNLDRLAAEANAILNAPGLGRITGVMGQLPNMPGGEAANAQARLETLKSQVGFAVLQAMRDASKTGGALGQVSNIENVLLQNNLGALDQAQSEDQFKAALQQIIQYTEDAKQRLSSAYRDTYGDQSAQPQAPAAAPAASEPPRPGTIVDGYIFRGGDPADPNSWAKMPGGQ